MYIVAQTVKDYEFIYSSTRSILCKNKKQADMLAKYFNENNASLDNFWKLKDGQIYFVYLIDRYGIQPNYCLSVKKDKISIREYL